ncbi:MAG: hypothetical protein CL549_06625 [Alcanivorax sp.]|nr:hypothetical protein [Alcanivorax sp.]MAY10155.1 hypothetical protein [Alcanivorax sp.]MBI53600.1 hypothetical protein [Alcanivorax sp.]MBM1144551.1 exopolysaccharide biosynthesis polyprenyl glycosylphosphotransferase [Alcanivorax sp. ZXX171]|tara:strand:- start:18769 stop:20049 length:1281 start_codon:yes stop_codon:yes gene_type:complete
MQQQHSVHAAPSRHDRWYEKLFLNPVLGHATGLGILIAGAQFLSYQGAPRDENQATTLMLLASIYLISMYLSQHIGRFAGGRALAWTLGTTLLSAGLVITVVLLCRIGYARTSLVVGMGLLLGLQTLSILINRRFRHLKLAVVPSSLVGGEMPRTRNVQWRYLARPELGDCRYDGLVVDMHARLDDDWIRFISHCSIAGLPVLDSGRVFEAIQGKVDLTRLKSTDLGSLQPSPVYLSAKRALDLALSVLMLPLIIPVCLVVALLIRLDSPGPALFVQERVGRGNRVFRMYKFRSMRPDDGSKPQFADEDAHRITRLGAFIRKFRIDELPQIFNVLRGDMSLIGPRPEQPGFVERFEQEVPFYSYRHIIRPGITGWAQVAHGYATDTESTRQKVEHDFYYIKNLSLGLDLLILMRTVRTVFTGFGAL